MEKEIDNLIERQKELLSKCDSALRNSDFVLWSNLMDEYLEVCDRIIKLKGGFKDE